MAHPDSLAMGEMEPHPDPLLAKEREMPHPDSLAMGEMHTVTPTLSP